MGTVAISATGVGPGCSTQANAAEARIHSDACIALQGSAIMTHSSIAVHDCCMLENLSPQQATTAGAPDASAPLRGCDAILALLSSPSSGEVPSETCAGALQPAVKGDRVLFQRIWYRVSPPLDLLGQP